MGTELVFGVSDFVAYLNQTLEAAYPFVAIEGEIANLRVSKNRWVYFDLKDEFARVSCFATVYQLPGPLEDGLVVRVSGTPRLHPQYNFSVNVQSIVPVGEGSIKRASDLLRVKLAAEGLFDEARKRVLPYPPSKVGLVTAAGSAAYADFIKIAGARWRGLEIIHANVAVQGDEASGQIAAAIAQLNALPELPDVIVITRGGGSVDDLQAFSTETVVRAVAASRVPTLVAIGHEIDLSLAELAADKQASTPSNAAELLLPDRTYVLKALDEQRRAMARHMSQSVANQRSIVEAARQQLFDRVERVLDGTRQALLAKRRLVGAYDPELALRRGYALVRTAGGELVKRVNQVSVGQNLQISLRDGTIEATANRVKKGKL
ncbi:MAG: exodeoxyribonuclease VII large subunit [Candidatus Saccharimonadales bacterium]